LFALAYAGVEVMSFGIKYLCAVATKSPTNHEKNIANDHAHFARRRRLLKHKHFGAYRAEVKLVNDDVPTAGLGYDLVGASLGSRV
jgi:hypothetical protein